MKLPANIEPKQDLMMGKPWVKGTRIPVYLLLQKMGAGGTSQEILADYPQLKADDLKACLQYAGALASEEVVLAEA